MKAYLLAHLRCSLLHNHQQRLEIHLITARQQRHELVFEQMYVRVIVHNTLHHVIAELLTARLNDTKCHLVIFGKIKICTSATEILHSRINKHN